MNIFQLKCFLAVSNTLSFARAAEQLNVSQPTISHQIKTLEEELNVKLFRRSTRFVEITQEGQSFINDARSMIIISERAKRRFSIEEEHPMAVLSIGCSSYAEFIMLSEVFHEMSLSTPHFHPRLVVTSQDRLLHLLETEQVDIVLDTKSSEERKSSIKYKELALCPITCVCRFDHHLADRPELSIRELQQESLIFCDPINISVNLTKFQFRLAEIHAPKDIHFSSSIDGAIALATAGIGITFLPDIFVADTPQLACIPLTDAPVLSFGMFYQSFPGDSLVKLFIQKTTEYFQSQN